jgi:hypothetical protein
MSPTNSRLGGLLHSDWTRSVTNLQGQRYVPRTLADPVEALDVTEFNDKPEYEGVLDDSNRPITWGDLSKSLRDPKGKIPQVGHTAMMDGMVTIVRPGEAGFAVALGQPVSAPIANGGTAANAPAANGDSPIVVMASATITPSVGHNTSVGAHNKENHEKVLTATSGSGKQHTRRSASLGLGTNENAMNVPDSVAVVTSAGTTTATAIDKSKVKAPTRLTAAASIAILTARLATLNITTSSPFFPKLPAGKKYLPLELEEMSITAARKHVQMLAAKIALKGQSELDYYPVVPKGKKAKWVLEREKLVWEFLKMGGDDW